MWPGYSAPPRAPSPRRSSAGSSPTRSTPTADAPPIRLSWWALHPQKNVGGAPTTTYAAREGGRGHAGGRAGPRGKAGGATREGRRSRAGKAAIGPQQVQAAALAGRQCGQRASDVGDAQPGVGLVPPVDRHQVGGERLDLPAVAQPARVHATGPGNPRGERLDQVGG